MAEYSRIKREAGDKMGDYSSCWFGVGFKGGFSLGPGFEDVEGFMFNVGDPSAYFWCGVSSLRVGMGLGGSVGLTLMMLTGCPDVKKMNKRQITDWGIDLSIGAKWSTLIGCVKHWDKYKALAEWGKAQDNILNPKRVDLMNQIFNNGKSAYQGFTSKEPELLTVDLPASFGLEASASYKLGTFRVYSETEGWSRRARYVQELKPSDYAGQTYTNPSGQMIGTFASDGALMMKGGRIPVK